MNKKVFFAMVMPALLLGAVSCTDYQDDIDKLGAENDALRSYNNQTISQLNSVVFQTEAGVVNITVDQPKATTIVYEVEPKALASTLAKDISRLSFLSQHGAAMAITAATGDDTKGTLTITIRRMVARTRPPTRRCMSSRIPLPAVWLSTSPPLLAVSMPWVPATSLPQCLHLPTSQRLT